jgi:hypothetical protein
MGQKNWLEIGPPENFGTKFFELAKQEVSGYKTKLELNCHSRAISGYFRFSL